MKQNFSNFGRNLNFKFLEKNELANLSTKERQKYEENLKT